MCCWNAFPVLLHITKVTCFPAQACSAGTPRCLLQMETKPASVWAAALLWKMDWLFQSKGSQVNTNSNVTEYALSFVVKVLCEAVLRNSGDN